MVSKPCSLKPFVQLTFSRIHQKLPSNSPRLSRLIMCAGPSRTYSFQLLPSGSRTHRLPWWSHASPCWIYGWHYTNNHPQCQGSCAGGGYPCTSREWARSPVGFNFYVSWTQLSVFMTAACAKSPYYSCDVFLVLYHCACTRIFLHELYRTLPESLWGPPSDHSDKVIRYIHENSFSPSADRYRMHYQKIVIK
jgi:hypothetical protein